MEAPPRELSHVKFSPPSANQGPAQENLVRCLDALDQKGEAGLEAELDRIYPPASAEDDGHPLLHAVIVDDEGQIAGCYHPPGPASSTPDAPTNSLTTSSPLRSNPAWRPNHPI